MNKIKEKNYKDFLVSKIGLRNSDYGIIINSFYPEFPEFITREGQRLTPRIIPSASS